MDSPRTIRHLVYSTGRVEYQNRSSKTSLFLAVLLQLILSTFLIVAVHDVYAAIEPSSMSGEYLNMPREYGEVIYRINPESSKQLYIIGISHRDPSTGLNSRTTVTAQKEIYRIGEWLKENAKLDLLLPEGYFNETDCSVDFGRPVQQVVDNVQLEQELAAEAFINAEILLMEHLGFRTCQVEDKAVYRAVRSSLDRLTNSYSQRSDFQQAIDEIRYLQEVRTAQLLQDIPGVIENQFDNGVIGERSAMFTIGLNHIKDIFRYIENGNIDIAPTLKAGGNTFTQQSPLNLLKAGYGISIILPRSLADNLPLLERTKIDRILLTNAISG